MYSIQLCAFWNRSNKNTIVKIENSQRCYHSLSRTRCVITRKATRRFRNCVPHAGGKVKGKRCLGAKRADVPAGLRSNLRDPHSLPAYPDMQTRRPYPVNKLSSISCRKSLSRRLYLPPRFLYSIVYNFLIVCQKFSLTNTTHHPSGLKFLLQIPRPLLNLKYFFLHYLNIIKRRDKKTVFSLYTYSRLGQTSQSCVHSICNQYKHLTSYPLHC